MKTSKSAIFSFILFLVCTIDSSAKISPYYKEVIQRGYEYTNDTVIFPDGSKCAINDFNKGICGEKWMTDDYCISKGEYVWDEHKCCNDLAPSLEEGSDGQSICAEKKAWWDINYFSFWLGLLFPFALFLYVSFGIRNRLRKRNQKK